MCEYHPIPFLAYWPSFLNRLSLCRRSLRKPLRSAKNSEVPCALCAVSDLIRWVNSIFHTESIFIFSCCIWFHVGIPDAIPFPALRMELLANRSRGSAYELCIIYYIYPYIYISWFFSVDLIADHSNSLCRGILCQEGPCFEEWIQHSYN